MAKKVKLGRPRKYDFSKLKKGNWVEIDCNGQESARQSLYYYAKFNNLSVFTRFEDNKLLVYML